MSSLPSRIIAAFREDPQQAFVRIGRRLKRMASPLWQGPAAAGRAVGQRAGKAVRDGRAAMVQGDEKELIKALKDVRKYAALIPELSTLRFEQLIEPWREAVSAVKDGVYVSDKKLNMDSREEFEYGWGAYSVQYAIDCMPEIHRVLKTYYTRAMTLKFVDIGAGSGAGANVFTLLHSDHHIYSKLEVEAVDHVPARQRWVQMMYPKVKYSVTSLEKLPPKHYDLVYCSHVIEHLRDPQEFARKLMRVCKGFVFIYTPYKEVERIAGHLSTITEEVFAGLPVESMKIMPSMGWRPAAAGYQCILVVLDCREKNPAA